MTLSLLCSDKLKEYSNKALANFSDLKIIRDAKQHF